MMNPLLTFYKKLDITLGGLKIYEYIILRRRKNLRR